MVQAAKAAAELLQAWGSAPHSGQQPAAPAHVVWALRVVCRASSSLPSAIFSGLIPVLTSLAEQPTCAAHVAATAACFAAVEPMPVVSFCTGFVGAFPCQQLHTEAHWVSH